jgi:uncharacterized protein YkwD
MPRRLVPLALVASLALASLACEQDSAAPEVPDNEFCAEVATWDDEAAAYEREVLERVNLIREAGASCNGVPFEPAPALVMDDALRCAARVHALDMATRDYVAHASPDEVTYEQRASSAGYAGTAVAQNIASGMVEPRDLVEAWMGSESSCMRLLLPTATDLGVGYVESDEATFGTYWVAVFGE